MRLRLDAIADAAETLQPDGCRLVQLPPLTLVLSPLVPAPAQDLMPASQVQGSAPLPAVAGRDCPPDCQLRILSEESRQTSQGWPLRVLQIALCRTGNTAVLAERTVAVYEFLRYSATVLVRGAEPGPPTPQLNALLSSGRPEWHDADAGTITSLWDIWH